jgi:tetratricopeptide (TPR) repeat protein
LKRFIQSKYILTAILSVVLLSCSTQKNTLMTRGFHNLTAHYNVYFNGNEAMEEGLLEIQEEYEEDYTRILPIFKESLPGTESMVSSNMNRSVDKATKLIRRHSITAQPESNRKQRNARKRKPVKPEYNRWVDDAFIMMGRAYLYKKEYLMASTTFTQMIRKYKDQPEKYRAYLWLIRTYNEAGRYTEAQELIDTMEGDDKFPEDLEGELAIVSADLQLKQQKHEETVQYLNIGIQNIRGNQRKARYNYILGQLYQELGNNEKALEAYRHSIRRRPDYEMMFNARINSASVLSGNTDVAGLRKELLKMSKKKRNEPFLDQIYYALGNIMYNDGRIDDAVELYRKSAALALENDYQRAQSCLTLANIYFDRKEYVPAGQYYDSAMVVIDENYPKYEEINEQYQSLNLLVTNILTVETEDSLQNLASLSDAELEARISKWIEAEEARIVAQEEAMASGDYGSTYNRYGSRSLRNRGGGWYFYNPSTVSRGKQDFQRLWGDRPNEDNWRRSDKSSAMLAEMGEEGEVVDSLSELTMEEPRIDDPTTREYYMQDIPTTDSLMAVSNNRIRDALFTAGNVFKNDFNDYERAISNFRNLNKRFPGNMYQLPAYFNLWDIYKTLENADSAAYYKNLIIDNYPESNYAKYLINPNFFVEEQARKDSLNHLYQMAFTSYARRNFKQAVQYSNQVAQMKPDADLKSKARFIKVVSDTRDYENNQFADSLEAYISKYPNAEPTPLAKQILELVKEEKLQNYDELVEAGYLNDVIKNLEILAQEQQDADSTMLQKWNTEEELLHYFVIAFPNNGNIDVNRLKFDIANYNIDHYTTLDFDIETETLNSETKLIVVRNFFDKESSLIYFLSVIRQPEVFKTLAGHEFLNFVISNENFREMLNERSYNEYLKYFVKNYSIHTTGEFPEEALDSPEELMAKLQEDETENLQEQGEFVRVEADTSMYEAAEGMGKVYDLDYGEKHSFVVMVKEQRFKTGFLMRDFVRYNMAEHRQRRLRAAPRYLDESTILVVSSFGDAYDALVYKNTVDDNKKLFETIGDAEYETFVIGENNLKKLQETNKADAWQKFYRQFYVYNKVPEPERVKQEKVQKEEPAEQTEEVQSEQEETEETTALPETNDEPAEAETASDEETATESQAAEVSENEEAPDEVVEDSETVTPTETQSEVTDELLTESTEEDAAGMYSFDPEALHNLMYILPQSGSNQNLLITYLRRLNVMQFKGKNITISPEDFDDIRTLVIINGLGNAGEARKYMDAADEDSRVKMSLRNANHRSFIISDENLDIFRQEKDINGYKSFYEKNY